MPGAEKPVASADFTIAISGVCVAGIVTFDVTVWYSFVSLLFSREPVRRSYERIGHWIERTAGAVMVGFGLKLLLARD